VERTSSLSTGDCSEGSDDASNGTDSHDEVEHALSHLAEHGGVQKLNALLANAIPPQSAVLDTQNIQEWSFKDIIHMPTVQQKDWIDACRQELDSLHAREVYDLVDAPLGRKIIHNRWVFDQKTDGWKRARLVAKGFS
jgi:hypothetical protein